MTIYYNATDRKPLVKAISEFTGAKPVYLKTLTYAYRIDYFTVTREGNLEFDDMADSEEIEKLIEALAQQGFIGNEYKTERKILLKNLTGSSAFGEGRLLQLGIHIEVVIVDTFLGVLTEQGLQLRRLKTGQGYIKIGALKVSDQEGQLVIVPFAADFIERHIQRFFLFHGKLHHNTVHFGHAHVDENLQALVTTDNTSSGLIPDDRLNIAELLNGALQLFIFLVAGFQIANLCVRPHARCTA